MECGGFNAETDALLQISATVLELDDQTGKIHPSRSAWYDIKPFAGANIEAASVAFTGIDPYAPERGAIDEGDAIRRVFSMVRSSVKRTQCSRAILVGHNAAFDHRFLMVAAQRCGIKRNPFHPFSFLDTVSLAALACGQTVLRHACRAMAIPFNEDDAHHARYDEAKTTELCCAIFNRWDNASFDET